MADKIRVFIQLEISYICGLPLISFLKKDSMNDSMVDRLDENEPVTITEVLEIPQPRAVGSPLPRGNGSRVPVPPTYAELEDRSAVSHPGPVLAPPSPISFSSTSTARAAAVAAEAVSSLTNAAPEPAPAPASLSVAKPAAKPVEGAAPSAPPPSQPERPRALQTRPSEPPSTLQRAALVIRQAIPIVQKLLPLLDGNFGTAVSNILNPPPPPPVPAPPAAPAPAPLDLAPLKEHIAELQTMHQGLREQIGEQNNALKRVEDHLELVREATDRNTLEQQELLEDLKSMGSKVNVVAAIAIGLLAISLIVNMVLYMHIQRVLP